jgi:molecular chaperone DnaK (HSP70)
MTPDSPPAGGVPVHGTCHDGWQALFSDDDLYCRMCGKKLLDCRLSPSELVFVVDLAGGPPAAQVVSVDNSRSVRPARLTHVATQSVLEVSTDSGGVVEVPAGHVRPLTVRVNGNPLEGVKAEVRSDLRFSLGRSAMVSVPIRIGAVPSFEHEVAAIEALTSQDSAHAVGRLRQIGGVATTITNLTVSHPAFTQSGLHQGQTFETGIEHSFELRCEPSRLGAGSHAATLTVEGAGGWTVVLPLAADVLHPGRLTIDITGRARQLPQYLTTDVIVSLQNDGDAALVVHKLDFPKRPAWFSVPSIDAPVTIGPRHAFEQRCTVDASRLELGIYRLPVEATLADGTKVSRSLSITVVELPVFEDFVAIDFGTSNSCVAYWTDEGVAMVPFGKDSEGNDISVVPSVAYYDDGHWLVGPEAAALARANPDRAVRSVKRLLNDRKITKDPRKQRRDHLEVGERTFSPEDVATEIFQFLKATTEQHLYKAIEDVMISVPANFTDSGIQAILSAARRAGLRPFREDRREDWHDYRIDEPTAAALEAAIGRAEDAEPSDSQRFILIFDFGGGTLDVSILMETQRPDMHRIEVLANKGANLLGGDDFTMALVRMIVDAFPHKQQDGSPVRYDVATLKKSDVWLDLSESRQREVYFNFQNLWEAAERAKIALSRRPDDDDLEVPIVVDLSVDGRTRRFETTVARTQFEARVESLVAMALKVVDRTVRRAERERPGFNIGAIDEVIATGSASLMPLVRRRLAAHLQRELQAPFHGFSEKACVARGTCRYAMRARVLARGARLELVGIHDQTNCSYGFDATAGKHSLFQMVIPEGEHFTGHNGNRERETYSGEPATINRAGPTVVTIYQHTGDPDQPGESIIENNPDLTAIDRIVITGVKVVDKSRPPTAVVRMWLADDGMLDAEARVEGHSAPFALEQRHRSKRS